MKAEANKRTADVIKEYLMGEVEKYIDFIFIGNSGIDVEQSKATGDGLGSVASEVIRHTKLNCMFVLGKTKWSISTNTISHFSPF